VAEVMGVLGPGAEHPTLAGANGVRLAVAEVGRKYLVGRAASCDLVLDDPSVAAEHVWLRRDYRGVTAADMGSQFGLYVNDQFAAGERGLRDGDVLSVGKVQLTFSDPAEVYLARLEQVPTPEEGPSTTVRTQKPAVALPARRGELVIVAVAAAVAMVAAAGLVYLWAS
jgi:pSer/pThr/pTyr-binding forkhead associated (FHA) protein